MMAWSVLKLLKHMYGALERQIQVVPNDFWEARVSNNVFEGIRKYFRCDDYQKWFTTHTGDLQITSYCS